MINYYPLFFKNLVINYYKSSSKVTIKDTIKHFNISNGSLFNWITLKINNNLPTEKKSYIRKTKITPLIKCYIRTYIIRKINFNYKLLIKQIKNKFKISISKSSLYKIINKLNITRKKIKKETVVKNKIKHNRDVRKFLKTIKEIPLNKIISIDESHFNNEITSNYGWSIKGKQIFKKIYIKIKKRYTLICAVSNKKVVHYKIIDGSSNAIIFKNFLEELNNKTSNNKYLLLDNARIHHSKIVKEYMEHISHKLIYNAPYSPEYNPIEKVFSKIKTLVRQKSNNGIPKKLQNNIKYSLKKITSSDLTNYFNKSLIQ